MKNTLTNITVLGAAVALIVPLLCSNAAKADPTISIDDEGGLAGVIISGGGWPPGAKVRLHLKGKPKSNYGNVVADEDGYIDAVFKEAGTQIDVGDKIYGQTQAGVVSLPVVVGKTVPPPPPPLVIPDLPDHHLHLVIHPTNLPEIEFTPGPVDLIGTSANVNIISETTSYDYSTDTITTDGFFGFAPGAVIFTYQATGVFPFLVDPATGDPLTGVQTTDWALTIGTVVPEPGAWAMMLCGLGGVGAALRGLRRRELTVAWFIGSAFANRTWARGGDRARG